MCIVVLRTFVTENARVLYRHDCDNTQHNAPSVSFHRLPLKKPSLLKQVISELNGELHLTPLFFIKWLDKLRLVDTPIYEANARVCSDHFSEDCYVSSILKGFGPSRRTLKPDAVPTIFAFNSPPKRRKFSEARQAKAQHRAVVEELLEKEEVASCSSVGPLESAAVVTTRDVGIQCGKLRRCIVTHTQLKL